MRARGLTLAGWIVVMLPYEARAATMIDGAAMRWPFALPFAGLLLSIAMGPVLIRTLPLIRADISRRHSTHVAIFFIILVGNVGGALSPLGDPPLLVGFLHGVDFFWTTRNLWIQTAIIGALLLLMFFAVDM